MSQIRPHIMWNLWGNATFFSLGRFTIKGFQNFQFTPQAFALVPGCLSQRAFGCHISLSINQVFDDIVAVLLVCKVQGSEAAQRLGLCDTNA